MSNFPEFAIDIIGIEKRHTFGNCAGWYRTASGEKRIWMFGVARNAENGGCFVDSPAASILRKEDGSWRCCISDQNRYFHEPTRLAAMLRCETALGIAHTNLWITDIADYNFALLRKGNDGTPLALFAVRTSGAPGIYYRNLAACLSEADCMRRFLSHPEVNASIASYLTRIKTPTTEAAPCV